ncbi:MAG TPA: NirD/YgiW/YdeI family stress tolerance protein [Woeseiaceae bacterium]|nr:NirD/YgiW/YdeI family stress tolerance protein [Woeseiaceae bacterium]
MKYTFIALALSAAALAQADGFNGPGDRPQPATAAEAANLPDDAEVTLSGYIVRSLGDERYEFQDDTGTLIVEIDDDEWQGAEITPNDPVELTGELDHEGRELELEVDHIRLTQAQ